MRGCHKSAMAWIMGPYYVINKQVKEVGLVVFWKGDVLKMDTDCHNRVEGCHNKYMKNVAS